MSRNDNGILTSLGALVVGAAAGAAAVLLVDEKNRKKVQKTLKNWMDMSEEKVGEMKDAVEEGTDKGRKLLAKQLSKVEKKLSGDDE